MAVEVIPDVKESVHPGEEEESLSVGRPATVSKIRVVVFGLHERSLELFGPDLGSPVTDSQEVLADGRVPLHGVDGSVVLSTLKPVLLVDFNRSSGSLVDLENVSLFSTHQILHGSSLVVVLDSGTSEDLLTSSIDIIVKSE